MASVLVTGANGFIGSFLVRRLIEEGHEVRGLVRPTSDLANLAGVPVSLFLGDVTKAETLLPAVEGVEYVYHLAAELLVTTRDEFYAANHQGTVNMLEAVRQGAAGTLERFVLVSSQAAAGPSDSRDPIDETRETRPVSWYGGSKQEAERAVLAAAGDIPVTIVRPSAVYGEREKDISQIFPVVEAHIHPKVGLGEKCSMMVYVGDLVDGILAASRSPDSLGEIYFLNHPEVLTTKDVVKSMARAMDKPRGLTIPTPVFLLRTAAPAAELIHHLTRARAKLTRDKVRELNQAWWTADPSKAKRDFGWEASHGIVDGMRLAVAYHRAEEARIRRMPRERPWVRWLLFVLVGCVLGALIETASYINGFYSFDPGWLVFVVVFGAFGLTLGTAAWWLRTRGALLQFVVGTVLAGAAEAANEAWFHAWTFAPGWPFGITDPWLRSGVLGLAGGAFILLVTAIMVGVYRGRERLG